MTQRTVFKIALVGLPVGLALSIVVALWLKMTGRTDRPQPSRGNYGPEGTAAIFRQPVNEKEIGRFLKVLTQDIGSRHHAAGGAGESGTVAWLQGSLGSGNMGYRPEKRDFQAGGAAFSCVLAEVSPPSGGRGRIVVLVPFDGRPGDEGKSDQVHAIAATLSAAHAITGEPFPLGLTLVFAGNEIAPTGKPTGWEAVKDQLLPGLKGVLDLRSQGDAPAVAASPASDPWTISVDRALSTVPDSGLRREPPRLTDVPCATVRILSERGTQSTAEVVAGQARALETVIRALASGR